MPPQDPFDQVIAALTTTAEAFFTAWRRTLGRLASAGRRVGAWAGGLVRGRLTQWSHVARHLRRPGAPWTDRDAAAVRATAAFGGRAFLAGVLGAGAVALMRGHGHGAAVEPLLVETVWAVGRLAVCALLIPPDALPRHRLVTVFLIGLSPYLLALTGALRLLALAVSAALTLASLGAAGLGVRQARRAVAWAFGGQAAVVLAGLALRGGLAALIAA